MRITSLVLLTLLSLVLPATVFAEHKQPGHHHSVQNKHAVHKTEHHLHRGSDDSGDSESNHTIAQHPHSYQVYSNYKVYRTVKRGAAHPKRHYGHNDPHDEHRLAYDNVRHPAYRLIAGSIVLNEVLHHGRH